MKLVAIVFALVAVSFASPALAHGGGLNACGCHFDHKHGGCHCHRAGPCGCACDSCGGGRTDAGSCKVPLKAPKAPVKKARA